LRRGVPLTQRLFFFLEKEAIEDQIIEMRRKICKGETMIERIQSTSRVERGASCTDPRLGEQVYDYYNGVLEADGVRRFEQHLIQCAYCEKVVFELDHIFFTLEEAEMERNSIPPKPDRLRVEPIQRLRSKRS
jgi:hypothetical protein